MEVEAPSLAAVAITACLVLFAFGVVEIAHRLSRSGRQQELPNEPRSTSFTQPTCFTNYDESSRMCARACKHSTKCHQASTLHRALSSVDQIVERAAELEEETGDKEAAAHHDSRFDVIEMGTEENVAE